MNAERSVPVQCPYCHHAQDVSYCSSVNATLEPQMKDRILDGTLNACCCRRCSKTFHALAAFLYHDMDQRLMINFNATGEKPDFEESRLYRELEGEGYIFRTVYSLPALVEKILVFDHSLNDKILEAVKRRLIRSLFATPYGQQPYMHFKTLRPGLFGSTLYFSCFIYPEQAVERKVRIRSLDAELRRELFNIDLLRHEGWQTVDVGPYHTLRRTA